MNFDLTDDQRMLSETLERFLADKYPIEQRHEFAAGDDGFSRDIWQQMAELGVAGALFPESTGGFGGTGDDIAVVFEQLGRKLVVEPFLPSLLAGTVLASVGGQDERMASMIAGDKLAALAHYEPQSRYSLEHVEADAKEANGSWLVSGSKSVVLGGGTADWLIVSARTSGNATDTDGISLFIVDRKAPGVAIRDYGTVDGYAAAEIALDGAEAELIGGKGAGFAPLENTISRGILAVCAEGLGAMEVAKDQTVEYMHTRKQFGVPIGKFQVLQHRMADVLIELEQMRSAVINASSRVDDEGTARDKYVSAAKYLLGTIGRQVAEEAIQIHGGMGMTWEYPVGHYAKRIIMLDHLFGDTDHHLTRYIAAGK